MLARLPLAIDQKFDPCAVHQQIQGAICASIGHLNRQCFMPPKQGRIARHILVQVRQFQQAGHHAGRLPLRQLEQDLDPLSGHCCAMTSQAVVRHNWIASSENTVGERVCHQGMKARSFPCPARSATSRFSGAPQCTWTNSSSDGSGRQLACSCCLSNRMDSRCEPSNVRLVQQHTLHVTPLVLILHLLIIARNLKEDGFEDSLAGLDRNGWAGI